MEQRIVRPTPAPTAKTTPETAHFQAGGVLRETSFYVERDADNELFEQLNNGEFCYVLAPRQIGKSSLRVRTRRRLAALGVRCVEIDLTMIGSSGATEDTWFYSIAWALAEGVGDPSIDLEAFWSDNDQLTPVARWTTFLRDEIAAKSEALTVIFLDELDTVLGLPFSADDFFAAIRELYNCRARDPVYERLTFCLLGLADPANLIADPGRTPFNIGRAIALDDFTPEQATVFLAGLGAVDDDPRLLVDAVLAWTDGHPYMTQLLCAELATSGAEKAGPAKERVAALVNELFLNEGRLLNPNLEYAERYLSKKDISALSTNMLLCYRQLLEQPRLESDPSSRVELHLKLAGLAAVRADAQGRRLATRNRIFAEVFDLAWVKEKEAGLHFGAPLQRWLDAPPAERDDLVLRGRALTEAVGSRAKRTDVSAHEEDFLRASQEVARREIEQKAAADLERERRVRVEGRVRILILAAAGLLCALGVALWQYRSASAAREAAKRAELSERGARAELLSRQDGHEIEGLVLGVSAVGPSRADPADAPPGAIAGLVSAVMAARTSFPLRGHTGIVLSAKFSPDGTQLLTTSRDKTARLWNTYDKSLQATLTSHPSYILDTAYSPDGTRIATISSSNTSTACLWDAHSGQLLFRLADLVDRLQGVAFSPDGTTLITWGNKMQLWNVTNGKLLGAFDASPDSIVGAAFLPDGPRAIAADRDGFAQLWDVSSGRPLAILDDGDTTPVIWAAFSPNGTRVVTGYNLGKSVILWDSRDGGRIADLRTGPGLAIRSHAVFSPDSTRVAVADRYSMLSSRIFDSVNGTLLATLEGHTGGTGHVSFSADSGRVATASEDGTARVWDAHTGHSGEILTGHSAALSFVAFSPDGASIATASEDGTARIHNGKDSKPLITIQSNHSQFGALSPDGTLVATLNRNHRVQIWDTRDGKLLTTLGSGFVRSATFSPDSKRVLTTSGRGAQIWNVLDGDNLVILEHRHDVYDATFSPDGALVLTRDNVETAQIWGALDGRSLATLEHRSRVLAATFSPDGALVLTSQENGTVQAWEARSGEFMFASHGRVAAFLPDSTRILTVDNNTLRIQEARSGELLTTLENPEAARSVVFSPDGKLAVTTAYSSAWLWDIAGGKLLATMHHAGNIDEATVSPDGTLVVTTGLSGGIQLWSARNGQPIAVMGETKAERYSSLYATGDADEYDHGATVAFSRDGTRIVASTYDQVRVFPSSAQSFLVLACQLLRYQPEFPEIADFCTPFLNGVP